MAMKMLYRGPSTRLETLIEKIQQNTSAGSMIAPGAIGTGMVGKEFSLQELYSSHTSSSFSPSISDGMATPNSITNDTNDSSLLTLEPGGGSEKSFRQVAGLHPHHHLPHPHHVARHHHHHHHVHHRRMAGATKEAGKSSSKNHSTSSNNNNNNNNSSNHNNNNNNNNHSGNSNSKSLTSTYHCQFCEKTFPRLGYLKKHEQ
uniref:C2H2-type domain-containing protein n=1 Tax=Anopheles atroparvus TaxID=41427 RepID=A0AAG5DI72_ANOAO